MEHINVRAYADVGISFDFFLSFIYFGPKLSSSKAQDKGVNARVGSYAN